MSRSIFGDKKGLRRTCWVSSGTLQTYKTSGGFANSAVALFMKREVSEETNLNNTLKQRLLGWPKGLNPHFPYKKGLLKQRKTWCKGWSSSIPIKFISLFVSSEPMHCSVGWVFLRKMWPELLRYQWEFHSIPISSTAIPQCHRNTWIAVSHYRSREGGLFLGKFPPHRGRARNASCANKGPSKFVVILKIHSFWHHVIFWNVTDTMKFILILLLLTIFPLHSI